MLKRSFLAIPLVAMLSMSLLTACGDKKEAAAPAKEEKVLRVGTNPTFAPFEFQAKGSNDLTGFDIAPIVLGIGIGGTMDQAAVMSKKALLRDISVPHKDADYAKLEEEIMEMVNKTGIGPQLGGTTTCIGVNIEWGATHIAGLPVAVTIMCHAARHAHVVL